MYRIFVKDMVKGIYFWQNWLMTFKRLTTCFLHLIIIKESVVVNGQVFLYLLYFVHIILHSPSIVFITSIDVLSE